jgi:small subunit ribosomal protein S23
MAHPPAEHARLNSKGEPYMTKSHAYDIARKEFYFHRHIEDVERRIAKEEAMHVGAWFGPGPLEISMQLENKIYNNWKAWAKEQVELENIRGASQYTGSEVEELETLAATNETVALEDLDPSLLESEDLGGERAIL